MLLEGLGYFPNQSSRYARVPSYEEAPQGLRVNELDEMNIKANRIMSQRPYNSYLKKSKKLKVKKKLKFKKFW